MVSAISVQVLYSTVYGWCLILLVGNSSDTFEFNKMLRSLIMASMTMYIFVMPEVLALGCDCRADYGRHLG